MGNYIWEIMTNMEKNNSYEITLVVKLKFIGIGIFFITLDS